MNEEEMKRAERKVDEALAGRKVKEKERRIPNRPELYRRKRSSSVESHSVASSHLPGRRAPTVEMAGKGGKL